MFKRINKRDGRVVKFDTEKIISAITRAGAATGEFGYKTAKRLTLQVLGNQQNLLVKQDLFAGDKAGTLKW